MSGDFAVRSGLRCGPGGSGFSLRESFGRGPVGGVPFGRELPGAFPLFPAFLSCPGRCCSALGAAGCLRRRSGLKRPLPLDPFPPFTRSPLFSHRVVWRRSPDRFQPFLAFHALEVGQTGKRAAVGPWSLQRRRQGRGPAVSRAPGGCSGSLVRAPGAGRSGESGESARWPGRVLRRGRPAPQAQVGRHRGGEAPQW